MTSWKRNSVQVTVICGVAPRLCVGANNDTKTESESSVATLFKSEEKALVKFVGCNIFKIVVLSSVHATDTVVVLVALVLQVPHRMSHVDLYARLPQRTHSIFVYQLSRTAQGRQACPDQKDLQLRTCGKGPYVEDYLPLRVFGASLPNVSALETTPENPAT